MGRPVGGDSTVTRATINRTAYYGSVDCVTRGTGVMLLIISRADKALTCGHRRGMAAGTFAVQRDITGSRVIDVVVGPDTSGVTGRTVIRSDFMTDGAALQRIGRRVMTGGTAVMDLGIV